MLPHGRGGRVDGAAAYHAEGYLYLAPEARFGYLLTLPEAADIGVTVNAATREIKKYNALLKELLKKVSKIPGSVAFDAFRRIYEYFFVEVAHTEGRRAGRSAFSISWVVVQVRIDELQFRHTVLIEQRHEGTIHYRDDRGRDSCCSGAYSKQKQFMALKSAASFPRRSS